mgnify:CR=1 FL=1
MEKPCFTRNRAAISSPRSPTLLFSVFSAMYKKYTRIRTDNDIRETHRKYAGLLKHFENKADTHSCSSVSRITQEKGEHTIKTLMRKDPVGETPYNLAKMAENNE